MAEQYKSLIIYTFTVLISGDTHKGKFIKAGIFTKACK